METKRREQFNLSEEYRKKKKKNYGKAKTLELVVRVHEVSQMDKREKRTNFLSLKTMKKGNETHTFWVCWKNLS